LVVLKIPVLVCSLQQFSLSSRFIAVVPRIWNHVEVCLGPPLMKLPCSGGRTHHVIATLNYGGWNIPDFVHIVKDLGVIFEETSIDKVVAFYSGKLLCPHRLPLDFFNFSSFTYRCDVAISQVLQAPAAFILTASSSEVKRL